MCGACLSAVTLSDQQMKRHINKCSRLAPPPMTTLQESAHGEHSPKKSAHVSKHAGSKKKGHHSEKSWPASSASQGDSQAGDRRVTCTAGMSQESTAKSMKHCSWWKKKAKMHKKDKSGKWSSACLQVRHSFSSFHYIDSLNKLMSHSPVLVIIDIFVAIPCLCNAKVWVINVLNIRNNERLNKFMREQYAQYPKSNKAKTQIVMQG